MDGGAGEGQGDLKWQREGPGKREGQTPLDRSLGDLSPASWHTEKGFPKVKEAEVCRVFVVTGNRAEP